MVAESQNAPDAPPREGAAEGETLYALLAGRARRTSDGGLVAACAVGLAGAAAVGLFATSWWRLVPPLLTVAAFGAWGIADRSRDGALSPPSSRERAVRAAGMLAAAVGTLAALATGLVVTAAMVGRLIS